MYKSEIVEAGVEKQTRREIEIQSNLRYGVVVSVMQMLTSLPRHPHILRLYGYFHDEKRIFLMLEYASKGELYKQLAKRGRFSESRASRVSVFSNFLDHLCL